METVIQFKQSELQTFIAEIKQELFIHVNKSKQEEMPMRVKEACAFMGGIHPNTLRKKMDKGLPFHTDVDGEYYFYASEINHWIKSKKL